MNRDKCNLSLAKKIEQIWAEITEQKIWTPLGR